MDDGASRRGAAIAFYATLSLAPFLLVLAAVAAFFLGADQARAYLLHETGALVGSDAGALLDHMLNSGSRGAKGIAALIGIVTTLAGATAGFAELQIALNGIFRVRDRQGWRATVSSRAWSLLLVIVSGLVLVASLALTAVVSRGFGLFGDAGRIVQWIALVANEAVTLAIAALLFGVVIKVLPDRFVPWRMALRGGVLAAILFQVAKVAIGWYIGRAAGAAVYGAAAALVVLMLWIYFSAQVFLLGAEFASVSLRAAQSEADTPRPDVAQKQNGRENPPVAS